MNRFLLFTLFITPLLHGMEAPRPIVLELLQDERFNEAAYEIKSGADISCTDACGNTPLHYAVFEDNDELIKVLLERSANPNAQNCANQTPLHFVGYTKKQPEWFKKLIKAGARADMQDVEGKTALECMFRTCSNWEWFPWMKLFPDWPVDAYDSEGWTILHRLCMSRADWRNAHYYLKKGADPNAVSRNSRQATALHLAADQISDKIDSRELFSLLLNAGASSALPDGQGNTVFDIQMQRWSEMQLLDQAANGSIGEDSEGGAKFLLNNSRQKMEKAKRKALLAAAKNNHYEFVQLLLEHGAQAPSGLICYNPLHAFSERKFLDQNSNYIYQSRKERIEHAYEDAKNMIPRLLKAGAQINAITPNRRQTPLLLAMYAKNTGTMQALLEHGADPNIPDQLGRSATRYVFENIDTMEDKELKLKLITKHGARFDEKLLAYYHTARYILLDLLGEAVVKRELDTLKKLLDQGAWDFQSNYIFRDLYNESMNEEFKNKPGSPTIAQVYEEAITHPIPGPIYESKELMAQAKSWFTFLCAVNKTIPKDHRPPRDIRLKIWLMIVPPNDCIKMIPTKSISQYAWMYDKKTLVNALVARHLKCLATFIDSPEPSEESEGDYSYDEEDEDSYPSFEYTNKLQEEINAVYTHKKIKALLEESYGKVLDF